MPESGCTAMTRHSASTVSLSAPTSATSFVAGTKAMYCPSPSMPSIGSGVGQCETTAPLIRSTPTRSILFVEKFE